MKNAQESLGNKYGQSRLTMTICEVWLGWKAKLRKIWEEQSGLREGRADKICSFFGMSGQQEIETKFAQFLGGIGRATGWTSRQDLCSFLEELDRNLGAKIVKFLKGTYSWLLDHYQQKLHNSQGELTVSWPGAWQQKLCDSQGELAVSWPGAWQQKLRNS